MRCVSRAIAASVTAVSATGIAPGASIWSQIKKPFPIRGFLPLEPERREAAGRRNRRNWANQLRSAISSSQHLPNPTQSLLRDLSDALIQLISGHESKKSLEVYQHLALNTVEHTYQEAVRTIGI